MNLNQLPSIKKTSQKRIGRGHGSGKGKTSGRGTKGQKARRNIPLWFEGGARSLIKRMPFRRGHGLNKSLQMHPLVINVKALNLLKTSSIVDIESLISNKIVDAREAKAYGVKILGDGDLSVSLTVKIPVSKSAQAKIEKAGGKVEL